MKGWVDLSVLRISRHAVTRYCERIMRVVAKGGNRARALASIAKHLRWAEPEGPCVHEGAPQEAWRLHDCVVFVKGSCVTTLISIEDWEHKRREAPADA